MTTRLYNQKKHEQAKTAHRSCELLYWMIKRSYFLNPDVELNDEVDE